MYRSLSEVEAIARGTLDREAQPALFDRLDWFERTLRHVPAPGSPLIVRARADAADCWLFLMQEGRKATALASWYTLAFRPVFSGEPVPAARRAMLTASARRMKRRLDQITLASVPEADAREIADAFDRARWIAVRRRQTAGWTAQTAGMTFAEYWAARPGALRSTVKRKRAKAGIVTQVHTRFDPQVWRAYEQIYAASWKPEEGSLAFLKDMAEAEGAAGALRMGLASIDGTPVAAQLWTVENRRAIIHKLAHTEQAAEHSPGSVLTAAMFAHVIDEDRVDVVDFGTGDDAYKADWMDTRSQLYTVQLFNPARPRALLAAARACLGALVERRAER